MNLSKQVYPTAMCTRRLESICGAFPRGVSDGRTGPGDEAALLLLLFLIIWGRVKELPVEKRVEGAWGAGLVTLREGLKRLLDFGCFRCGEEGRRKAFWDQLSAIGYRLSA